MVAPGILPGLLSAAQIRTFGTTPLIYSVEAFVNYIQPIFSPPKWPPDMQS